ncbi:MAG: hypothetical protein II262_08505, partial [Alistipes sp.]|nr:hypothetical protein [Alistipes sp.]
YFGAVNLNCIVWDDNSSVGVGAEVINGYSFNKWFMLGAGVGANLMPYKGYKNEQVIEALIPIFVHTRFNILDRRVTPFFSLSIGGGILVDNYNKGASSSIYLDPKLGVAVRLKSGKMVDIGISRLFGGGIWIGPYNGIKFGVSYVW